MTGILAACALFMMLMSVVQLAVKLNKAQADLAKDSGPFSGLTTLIANSVGLEWGWLLLIGGALGVVVLALLTPSEIVPATEGPRHKTQDDEGRSFSSADQTIADYLENRKISPTIRRQSMPEQQVGFGKRRTL
jgi:hypothetical protein